MPGYHKYVFDARNRRFVGQFEQMYQGEESEGFDSWFERDLRPLRKAISYAILSQYQFSRILDVGCGKGTFTHLLKKQNNRVVGIDVSLTAIQKAKESFPDIEFLGMNARDLTRLSETFDLVVVMGTFAYIDGWPQVLETIAGMTRWCYVAEYIPPEPVGFVQSVRHLITEMEKCFVIRTRVVLDEMHCLLLAEVKRLLPEESAQPDGGASPA